VRYKVTTEPEHIIQIRERVEAADVIDYRN